MDIKQTFGMGSIRVGAWVTKEEKELAANLIFYSLADLAYILALPPEAIGLRGTLGLAFGSGGRKGYKHTSRQTNENWHSSLRTQVQER